jgi:membrane protease YdiL (CAAX protease family)
VIPAQNTDTRRPWQKKAWVQWVGITLIMLIYGYPCLFQIQNDNPLTARDILFNTIVIRSIMIIVLLVVLRFLYGEKYRDLNRKAGTWWKDTLGGIALAALTLGTKVLLDNPINNLFPRQPDSGLGQFFNEMVENPLIFALMIGPALIIGAGIGEELDHVFLLTRLWNLSSNKAWRWIAVILTAVLLGLAHLYQGTAGVISTGISGLIMGIYYLFFGRLNVMIIAHYLHDAIQLALIYFIANT